MLNYFLYTRKSTDVEDKQVRSIEDQLAVLRAFAKNEGLTIVDEFIEDSTATSTHNILLDNLIPSTIYQFRIKSSVSGATSTSNNLNFTTLANPSLTPTPTPTPASTTTPITNLPTSSLAFQSPASTKLVKDKGTFYIIQNGQIQGVTSPGILFSYGFEFKDAIPATAQDLALSKGSLLLPGNGALVKSLQDKTVYLIAESQRHAFTSSKVFTGLGFKFSSVLLVTNPELQALPKGANISSGSSAHLNGLNVSYKGAVYWIESGVRHLYPSIAIYNSWNIDNDFSRVAPANAADLKLPVGDVVTMRVLQ